MADKIAVTKGELLDTAYVSSKEITKKVANRIAIDRISISEEEIFISMLALDADGDLDSSADVYLKNHECVGVDFNSKGQLVSTGVGLVIDDAIIGCLDAIKTGVDNGVKTFTSFEVWRETVYPSVLTYLVSIGLVPA